MELVALRKIATSADFNYHQFVFHAGITPQYL